MRCGKQWLLYSSRHHEGKTVLIVLFACYSSCQLKFGYGTSSDLSVLLEKRLVDPEGTLSADSDDIGTQMQGRACPNHAPVDTKNVATTAHIKARF